MKNLLILIFLIASPILRAQDYYYYSLNQDNGLPAGEIYQVVQDTCGYIWVGTDAGLFRYNGFQFEAFTHPKQNAQSMSYLTFDAEKNLWCRNFSGQVFKVKNDSLILVADYSAQTNKFEIAFTEDPGYWKIEKDFISQHDANGKVMQKIPVEENLGKNIDGVEMIYFKNHLWIHFHQVGLFYLHTRGKKLLPVKEFKSKETALQERRFFIWKNELYILKSLQYPATENYIFRINTQNKVEEFAFLFYNPTHVRTYYFYEDRKQRLWTGTSVGTFCIPEMRRFTFPQHVCFFGEKISCVLEDNEGSMWFSGLHNGLYVIPNLEISKWNHLNSDFADDEISQIRTLSNGKIIFGTYLGNIGIFDTITQQVEYPEAIRKIEGITVKDIEEYKGKILISRGRMVVYDTLSKKAFFPLAFSHARDLQFCNDTLFILHPGFSAKVAFNDLKENDTLRLTIFHRVGGREIEKDPSSDDLYFALNNGLFLYRRGQLTRLYEDEDLQVHTLCSGAGSVWAGTHNKGVLEFRNGKIIRRFLNNGKPENSIKAIHVDEKNAWICTRDYLYQIDLSTGIDTRFSRNIGIAAQDIYSITSNGNQIYLGTKNGMITFPKTIQAKNEIKPKILLRKITLENRLLPKHNNLHLPFDFSNLQFDFLAFSYKSRKDLHYIYRMEGHDTTWIRTPHDNPVALYPSLPPGEYHFQVKAINESGLESAMLTIPIFVDSPLWQKGWFYFLMSLLVIFLITIFFLNRIKAIRRKNEMEKKLIASQLTALKAQMNPHFMYNALNSIQDLMLQQDLKNSNKYLGRFSTLMRKVLEASGKELISLREECDILELYLELEKLRFGDEFSFSINVHSEIDAEEIMIPPMILQPYVENAMKHGLLHKKGAKKLDVEFVLHEHLICTITDNGIGRKRSAEIRERKHQSFASSAVEKRIELLKNYTSQNFSVEVQDLYSDQEATGTRVIIHFPS